MPWYDGINLAGVLEPQSAVAQGGPMGSASAFDAGQGPVSRLPMGPYQPAMGPGAQDVSASPGIETAIDPKIKAFGDAVHSSTEHDMNAAYLDSRAQGMSNNDINGWRAKQEAAMKQANDAANILNQQDAAQMELLRNQMSALMAQHTQYPGLVQPRRLSQNEAIAMSLLAAFAPSSAAGDILGAQAGYLQNEANQQNAYNQQKYAADVSQNNVATDNARQQYAIAQQGLQSRQRVALDMANMYGNMAEDAHKMGLQGLQIFHTAKDEGSMLAGIAQAKQYGLEIPHEVILAKQKEIARDRRKDGESIMSQIRMNAFGLNLQEGDPRINVLQEQANQIAKEYDIPPVQIGPSIAAARLSYQQEVDKARLNQAETHFQAQMKLNEEKFGWEKFNSNRMYQLSKERIAQDASQFMMNYERLGAQFAISQDAAEKNRLFTAMNGVIGDAKKKMAAAQADVNKYETLKANFKPTGNAAADKITLENLDMGIAMGMAELQTYQDSIMQMQGMNPGDVRAPGMTADQQEANVNAVTGGAIIPDLSELARKAGLPANPTGPIRMKGATPTKGSPRTPSKKGGTPSKPAPSGKKYTTINGIKVLIEDK